MTTEPKYDENCRFDPWIRIDHDPINRPHKRLLNGFSNKDLRQNRTLHEIANTKRIEQS